MGEDGVGEAEVILPEEIDMSPDQRGEADKIVVVNLHAVSSDLLSGFLDGESIPMHDCAEGAAEGAELHFLPLLSGFLISQRSRRLGWCRTASPWLGVRSDV
jgi:hypothetical protein